MEEREKAFYASVGHIVRAWANIECTLWIFVAIILRIDQFRARIIMQSLPNLRARRELVSRLAETYLHASLLPELRRLMKRVGRLGQRRNLLVHNLVHIDEDGRCLVFREIFPTDMDGSLDFETVEFKPRELQELIKSIQELYRDLIAFGQTVEHKVHASAKTHREPQNDPNR